MTRLASQLPASRFRVSAGTAAWLAASTAPMNSGSCSKPLAVAASQRRIRFLVWGPCQLRATAEDARLKDGGKGHEGWLVWHGDDGEGSSVVRLVVISLLPSKGTEKKREERRPTTGRTREGIPDAVTSSSGVGELLHGFTPRSPYHPASVTHPRSRRPGYPRGLFARGQKFAGPRPHGVGRLVSMGLVAPSLGRERQPEPGRAPQGRSRRLTTLSSFSLFLIVST